MAFVDAEIADGDVQKFVSYCAKFGKSYIDQPEFKLRLYNWKKTEKFIQEQNWNARSHFKVGHNKFSDWTRQEMSKNLGYSEPLEVQVTVTMASS